MSTAATPVARRGIYQVPSWIVRLYQRLPFNIRSREGPVSFSTKVAVAIAIALVYIFATFIPLAFCHVINLSTLLTEPNLGLLPGVVLSMLGTMLGSIVSIGSAPLITGYIMYGLLTNSGLLEIHSAIESHAAKFGCIISMLILESGLFVFRPELSYVLSPDVVARFQGLFPGTPLGAFCAMGVLQLILFIQLVFTGLFLLFLDRLGEEYSFGSMVGLFIILGVLVTYAQQFILLLSMTFHGGLSWAEVLFFNSQSKGNTWLALLVSILFILILSILEAKILNFPFRGPDGRIRSLPYKIFFLGNVPTLLATIYLSCWGQILQIGASAFNSLNPGLGDWLYSIPGTMQTFGATVLPHGLFSLTNLATLPGYLPAFFMGGVTMILQHLVAFVVSFFVFGAVALGSTRLWCLAEQITPGSQAANLFSAGIRPISGRGTVEDLRDELYPYYTACVLGASFLLVLCMTVLNFLGPFANIPSSSLILTIGIIQGYLYLLSSK